MAHETEQNTTRLEDLLVSEFKDAVKLMRDETRELEREMHSMKLELAESKGARRGERAVLIAIGSVIGGLIAAAGQMMEMVRK